MDLSLQSPLLVFLPFIELFILFFLSKKVTGKIALFIHSFSLKAKWAYYILAFLFLPGTYIHELSHYLFAKLLFVKVYGMTLVPKIEKDQIRLGSVEIEKTDFIRRALVGAAPLLVGSSLLVSFMYYFVRTEYVHNIWFILLSSFLVFQVGNTMFLSKKDTEGSWKIILFLLLVFILAYVFGFDFQKLYQQLASHDVLFRLISFYLMVPIVIDIVLIVLLSIIT